MGRRLKIHIWYEEHPDIPRQPLDRDEVTASLHPLTGWLLIKSQIAAFEFEGYASDFIEYPAGMRDFLFAAVKLHTIVSPVTVLDM